MGKNNKNKKTFYNDWEEVPEDGSEAKVNGNGPKGDASDSEENGSQETEERPVTNGKVNGHTNGNHKGGKGNQNGAQDPKNDPSYDPYLDRLTELTAQLEASQKTVRNVQKFYNDHKKEINKVVQTRERLEEMKVKCAKYRIMIDGLEDYKKDKLADLDKEIAGVKEERQAAIKEKEAAENYKKELDEKKESFEKRVKLTEAEHVIKVKEDKEKYEAELNGKFDKRVEELEKETQEREAADKKAIADLTGQNKTLEENLAEEKRKLAEVERKLSDSETLKQLYFREASQLKKDLRKAQNEFELGSKSPEFYTAEFAKIQGTIESICTQYLKEIHVDDPHVTHTKIDEIDPDFAPVPISTSETSKKLCAAHAQRIISAKLQETVWQPFSSEATLGMPKVGALLSQASQGLITSKDDATGFRASRLLTALAHRGMKSMSSSSGRSEKFSDKVMAVLSLLVKPELHSGLRDDLMKLASSAITLWDFVQTDVSEVTVLPALDGTDFTTVDPTCPPPGNSDEIIVLFPRVTARSCILATDARPKDAPDAEVEATIKETLVNRGVGLPDWSDLVLQGEEEEDERRVDQDRKMREEEKRKLEENLERLMRDKTLEKVKRRTAMSRRDSGVAGVGNNGLSPVASWLGGRAIVESDGE